MVEKIFSTNKRPSQLKKIELDQVEERTWLALRYMMIPLVSMFALKDYFFDINNFQRFLYLRSSILLIIALYYLIKKFTKIRPDYNALIVCLYFGVYMSYLMLNTGGTTSPYTYLINLFGIGAVVFIPWQVNTVVMSFLFLYLPSVLSLILNGSLSEENVKYDFVIYAAGHIFLAGHVWFRLRRNRLREFNLRENFGVQNKLIVQSEKQAAIGKIMSGLSHEINNPLNFIMNVNSLYFKKVKLFLEMTSQIQKKGNKEINNIVFNFDQDIKLKSTSRSLEKERLYAMKSVNRITQIITSLDSFNQKTNKRKKEKVKVKHLVQESVKIIPSERAAQVEIKVNISDNLEIICHVDEMVTVFNSLIANSIDIFRVANRGSLIIVESDKKTSCISFVDDGPGVPVELRDKMFDPFYTSKDVGKGMGLGLSVARELLLNNGAKISYKPSRFDGAEFIIQFEHT